MLFRSAGAVAAIVALRAAAGGDLRTAFLCLFAAIVIDASDGLLARRVDVRGRLPQIDGGRLDDVVDYLTYVFVPAAIALETDLVTGWGRLAVVPMLLSSALRFAHADAKTHDHFFTGFPSYWNIVIFYMWVMRLSSTVNAAVLVGLSLIVLAPIPFVYPSRTPRWRSFTVGLGTFWAAQVLLMIWWLPAPPE